jgi:hypothetical protein
MRQLGLFVTFDLLPPNEQKGEDEFVFSTRLPVGWDACFSRSEAECGLVVFTGPLRTLDIARDIICAEFQCRVNRLFRTVQVSTATPSTHLIPFDLRG